MLPDHRTLLPGASVAMMTLLGCGLLCAQPPEDSPRMTPLVRVIQKIEPAVVSLFVPTDQPHQYASGSGTIIHPDGYVLTNNHVLPRVEGFAVVGEKAVRFFVIGRLPEKDIAVLKLRDVSGPLPTIPLGHSHDVMNGESVVVAGNPGGRGVVFTSGIVSAKSVMIDAPNALVMTQLFPTSRRDRFIQFDAASNRGNSGGPLVNMSGEVIGIVSALVPQEQNVGFAIPVDRVRELFDRIIEPEVIYERATGIRLNPQADQALVVDVEPDSAAAKVGLQSGDTIVSVAGRKLRFAADWTLALHKMLPTGNPLQLVARRGADRLPVKLVPEKKPPLDPVVLDSTEAGLKYKFYHGQFQRLPDFANLEPVRTGIATTIDLDSLREERSQEYALTLEGFVEVADSGLYRMTITSDDGSRVHLHNERFIDNDGSHPPMPASRLIRLKSGMHPIRIEQFQGIGGATLEFKLEKFNKKPEDQAEVKFFHLPEAD